MVNIKDVVDYPFPYFLRMEVFGGYPAVEITQFEFEEIAHSKRVLSSALDIENKYDILLSNYAEFESEISQLAIDSLLDRNREYDDFFEMMRRISLRLSNLLSSGRMYVDQIKHDVKSCVVDGDEALTQVKKLLSAQYDTDPYYRFMEEVRNYSQHRSLPVHLLSNNSSAEMEGKKKKLFQHTLNIYAVKNQLVSDKKFKSRVLEGMDEKIDLKKSVRRYVSALSEVHIKTRDYIASEVDKSELCLSKYMDNYAEEAGECSKVSLMAIHSEDGKLSDEVSISLEWNKSRRRLVKQNQQLKHLSMHYITSVSSEAHVDD